LPKKLYGAGKLITVKVVNNGGLMPIIGYNYGAKNNKRVISAVKYGCIYAAFIMFIGLVMFQLLPERLLMIFSSSDEMMAMGIDCLRIISIGFVFSGIAIVLAITFQAFGQAKTSLVVYFTRQIIVLLPVAIILSGLFGINGIWIAFPIAEITSLIIAAYYFNKVYKKELKYEISKKSFSDAIKVS
jgi:Na+-driven multidrug efflux pump